MSEHLEKFEPDVHVPRDLYLDGLQQHEHGLLLLLSGDDESGVLLVVAFEDVFSYRVTDEEKRLQSLGEWKNRERWPFFQIQESKYVAWFDEESLGLYQGANHYLFLLGDRIVDVLSCDPPVVHSLR